jgi:3-oxoacyl-[acyl-carrier protein] reductase
MNLGLEGRTAVVSGGSRGIGRAIATTLAREGANVLIVARTAAPLAEAQASIDQIAAGRCASIAADMTKPEEVNGVVAFALDRFGPVDIAISNVIGHVIDIAKEGSGPGAGVFATMPAQEYEREFEHLLVSAWALASAVVPDMRRRKWGRICNIGSGVAREPATHLPHVLPNVVRPAVAGFHRLIAEELRSDGITVNNILTGAILTERNRSYWEWLATERGASVAEVTQSFNATIPMRRMGEPAEMAALVAFLCSERAALITGQSIPVVGGGSAHL